MKDLAKSLIMTTAFASSILLTNPARAETNCDSVVNSLMEMKGKMEEKGITIKEVYRGKKGRYDYGYYKCIQDEVNSKTDGEYDFFIEMKDGRTVTKKGKTAYIFRKTK